MQTIKHTKRTAGQKGGQMTVARHGHEHMQRIGKQGARVFHQRYKLEPVFLSDFAIVRRETGEVIAYTSGRFGG